MSSEILVYTNFIATCLPENLNCFTKSVFCCLKTECTDFKGVFYKKKSIKIAIYLESVRILAFIFDDLK